MTPPDTDSSGSDARLYLVEDNRALRGTMERLFERVPGRTVVGTAGRAESAREEIARLAPDLVITDISLPEMSGLELADQLTGPPVIVFSIHEAEGYVRKARQAGVRGYVPKSKGFNALQEAVDRVLEGATYGLIGDGAGEE